MATASWRTCGESDGVRPSKFRTNRFIGWRVIAFPIFSNMAAGRHFELKNNIWSRDCHWGPNLLSCTKFHQNWFTRSASRRRQQHNIQYTVARQRTSPWQPHHGGHVGILTGCDHPSFVPIGSLVGELWRFQYFQHGGRPPFWILKILIFDHVAVIMVLICCCVPNFI